MVELASYVYSEVWFIGYIVYACGSSGTKKKVEMVAVSLLLRLTGMVLMVHAHLFLMEISLYVPKEILITIMGGYD